MKVDLNLVEYTLLRSVLGTVIKEMKEDKTIVSPHKEQAIKLWEGLFNKFN